MGTGRFTLGVEEEFLVVDRLRPALVELDDWDEVSELVGRVLADGTGADRQRRVLAETGDLRRVLDFVVEKTAPAAC